MEIDYRSSSTVCNMGWSNQRKELGVLMYDDVCSFPTHQSDFSVVDVPLLDEMFLNDNPYSSSPDSLVPDELICDSLGFWSDDRPFMKREDQNQLVVSGNNHWGLEMKKNDKMKLVGKRRRAVNYKSTAAAAMMRSKKLSWETVSKYFYMPITQAARELNVGLTLLKKRCRELGIRRWPHRKLNSLQTLINNVQELGNEGSSGDEGRLRENLQLLEQEKKLLEESPDMQLDRTTKRLRQAFFKANYKKRKLMGGMVQSESPTKCFSTTTATSTTTEIADYDENVAANFCGVDDYCEDEELKYLLAGCFTCNEDSVSVLKMIG